MPDLDVLQSVLRLESAAGVEYQVRKLGAFSDELKAAEVTHTPPCKTHPVYVWRTLQGGVAEAYTVAAFWKTHNKVSAGKLQHN